MNAVVTQTMEATPENFMPVLFKVLFGFIILNTIINAVLLYTKRLRIYKLHVVYWISILFIFMLQAKVQTGNLAVTMAYSAFIISVFIFCMIGFETIGRKFPWKGYLIPYACCFPLTLFLESAGFGFTVVAMPFSVVFALPHLHVCTYILYIDRKVTTRLQKVLGFIYLISAAHCINFALFRMDQGAQLWGWITSYALYDCLAIFLPSIALEKSNMQEQTRLQDLVTERTLDLKKSNRDNENILKVLLHDMSSPLMVTRFYASSVQPKDAENEELLKKIITSMAVMENIIMQVKNIYGLRQSTTKMKLNPVTLDDCFKDVGFIFFHKLEKKNIKLLFKNQLAPGTRVMADQTTLTHSVLSNLVSNCVKFSRPDTQIIISAKEELGAVILEITDEGPGIPENVIENVMNDKLNESTDGTSGEEGSGMGLSIVKNFVDSYGGQMQFIEVKDHGTNVRIILNRA
jgi:signal transduction histidine kinase